MSRPFAVRALPAILLLAAAPASAQGSKPPDAARVRQAAEQFDAGSRCFSQKDFACAASAFEAADAAVPSPKVARLAIRARVEAGQGSRAATLAAQALGRYPGDEAVGKLARETIEKLHPQLFK